MPAAEKMEMDVKYRLAGVGPAVDHDTVAVFRNAFLLSEAVGDGVDRADGIVIFLLKIPKPRDVLHGHEENVSGRLRPYVAKRDDPVVAINDVALDFPLDNPAEKAVGHTSLPRFSRRPALPDTLRKSFPARSRARKDLRSVS